jgi:hypothetical protein
MQVKVRCWTVLFVISCAVAATVFARTADAQYFGRNKVQYKALDFQIVQTEHFDVYYYEQEREAVMDAARMIERSYARLSKLLQHQFKQRKPIILYASHTDFQQTNALSGLIDESTGGVTEAYKNRVIMPFTGSYGEFDHVMTHELVHAFQYDIIFRRGIVNEANPFSGRLPLWFMEGMAEYLSIGRIDPHTGSWLRDATLNGYLRTIGEMDRRDDYLSYRFGQSLWAYIGQKWGDEVVGILLQKAPRMGIERAFETTLGLSLPELSREWTTNVRSTYLPQIADHGGASTFSKKLTDHDKLGQAWYLAPAISADGQQMLLISQRDGFFFDLWLADAQTGKFKKKLIEAAKDADFESLRYMNSSAAFSPDGRHIAFAAQTAGQDALYIYDLKRGRVVSRLKFALNGIANPSFSPDGRQLVFSGNEGGISDLFVTDLKGKLTRLTRDKFADLVPSWSPDGKQIAFTTDRGPHTDFDQLKIGNYRVAILDVATRRVDVLPGQDQGKNHNPVWSPDSKQLVWVNDANGINNLHLYDIDKSELSRISDVLSGVIAVVPTAPVLSWSQSGRLLFNYFEKAGYNIYAIDDPRTLPRIKLKNEEPQIAADANGNAFKSDGSPQAPAPDDTPAPTPQPRYQVTSFYKHGSTFRPSARRNEAPAAAPVSVVAMMDSANVALPDTAAFKHHDYSVKFTPDMIGRPTIGAQVGGYYGNGLYGGSYIALSDMLGNHHVVVAGNLNGSIRDASFLAGYAFLKTRANFAISMSQMPLYRYLGSGFIDSPERPGETAAANVFLRDVIRTVDVSISYPFSTFSRFELRAAGVYYTSDMLYRGYYSASREPLDHNEELDKLAYWQPSAALVYDNSLYGWTGPMYGRRYRFQISKPMGDFKFTEALIDFRNYLNFKQSLVFATRITALNRTGPDANRFQLYWGGPYFIRGYDAGSFELGSSECEASRTTNEADISQCPIRDQLIGSSAAFFNAEFRFPIIKQLQIGFLGNFPPVDLVTFFDGGVAWNTEVCTRSAIINPAQCEDGSAYDVALVWERKPGQDPYLARQPLFSYGLGLRLNIFYTVLRFDYAVPLNRPGRTGFSGGVFSLSFGPSF